MTLLSTLYMEAESETSSPASIADPKKASQLYTAVHNSSKQREKKNQPTNITFETDHYGTQSAVLSLINPPWAQTTMMPVM